MDHLYLPNAEIKDHLYTKALEFVPQPPKSSQYHNSNHFDFSKSTPRDTLKGNSLYRHMTAATSTKPDQISDTSLMSTIGQSV